jgi:hypothetical protein
VELRVLRGKYLKKFLRIFHAIFHEIKKEHGSFTANIGVRVRGVRVVRGKFFEN